MKRWFREVGVLLGLSACAAWVTWGWHPRSPGRLSRLENSVSHDVDWKWVMGQFDVQWVDARRSKDYAAGHIPGAWNIHSGNLDQAAFDYLEKAQNLDIPIVIYCSGASCDASHHVREVMERWGLKQAPKVFVGGWPQYEATGGPVEMGVQ